MKQHVRWEALGLLLRRAFLPAATEDLRVDGVAHEPVGW